MSLVSWGRLPRMARGVAWLVVLPAVGACAEDPIGPQVRRLSAAEALWRASSARDRYVISQVRECFCITGGAVFTVTVVNDTIVSVRNVTTGDDLPREQREWFRTVDQLFGEIRRAVASPGTLRLVEYDVVRGIPTTVSLDPVLNAVDDEIVYRTAFVGALGTGDVR